MYKVICIGEFDVPANYQWPLPVYGETYTVIAEEKDGDILMYLLAEFPLIDRLRFTFESDAFAPVNGPDEIEIAEGRQLDKELAEVMVELQTA